MKRAYIYFLCALIAVAGSLASIYLGPGVPPIPATESMLLTSDDIYTALRAGDFHLLYFTGPPKASPELGGVSPQSYGDTDTHDVMFIYIFPSVSDRIKVEYGGGENQLRTSWTSANLLPWFFLARNALIVYVMPTQVPNLEQFKIQNQWLRSLRDIVFFRLNGGRVMVFKGKGVTWKAEVIYRYYEHWFTDSSGRLQYECWSNEEPQIFYKGTDLKKVAPIQVECRFDAPGENLGVEANTDKNGFADLGDGGFDGSNGALARAGDTIQVKIKWDGKEESFSLRCSS
jgi:hypothetical protein